MYTDIQVKFLKELVSKLGNQWQEVAKQFNLKFDDNKTPNAIRKMYPRYEDIEFTDDTVITSIEKSRKSTLENQKLKKTQNILIDQQLTLDAVLSELQNGIKRGGFKPIFVPKYTADKTKKEMAIEILFSDIHALKKSAGFNSVVLEERIKEFAHVTMKEIGKAEAQYNVSTVIFAMLGDLIENSYFHHIESMSACEAENSEQIRVITELIYKYFIIPLGRSGKRVVIPCITGNHDRSLPSPTYNQPGKNALSWIVYNFLKMMAREQGLKNLEFIIPEGLYCIVEVFGRTIFYEHGSEIRSRKEEDIEAFIHRRAKQVKRMIDFYRIGDKHSYTVYNKGRIIINGSVCGQDSYSDSKGYQGVACQAINFYINRKQGCIFYKSFPVDLENNE